MFGDHVDSGVAHVVIITIISFELMVYVIVFLKFLLCVLKSSLNENFMVTAATLLPVSQLIHRLVEWF